MHLNTELKTIRYSVDAEQIVTLCFDESDSPVNTMTPQWQQDLTAVVVHLVANKDKLRGVILTSAKSTFFAGAELKGVLRLKASDAPAVFHEVEGVKHNFRLLETLGKPVVAVLNGSALGGGWELALAAHRRIALDNPRSQFGLPEVTLGLLPGASGVTKTVRMLGLLEAMPYLVEGKLMKSQDALALGLVHETAASDAAARTSAAAWIHANPAPLQPWDEKNYRLPGGGPSSPKIAQGLAVAPAMLRSKTRGLYPAPEAILSCMVEGAQVDFDTALRIESRYLAKLMVGSVAKNLISLFFNRNAIRSGVSRPKDVPRWKATKVGILGAGMMGAGIAWANASRGVACVLKDVTPERALAGKAYSEKLSAARVAKGRMDAQQQAALLALIRTTASADDLNGCDLIIEAVFEKRELKAEVTREAEPQLAAGGFFASNTSTLPITGLAHASVRPEKFIGLHFFSPVDKMELVEIIVGAKTDAETLARAYDYVLQIGKTPIVVNDSRGFFTSRTFGTFVMEGAAMLGEGIPATVIENAGLAAGMPVGPLAVLDETSLSLSLHVMEQTIADLAAEGKTYTRHPGEVIVERMVREFNRPGRAGGGGFYDYPAGEKKRLWPGLKASFERPDVAWDMDTLRDRLLYRQAIETARCLQENVLMSVHDANIGSIYGIGFPAWAGGALQFINSEGLDHFVARARELEAAHGARFAVPQIVLDKQASGQLFV